MSRTEAPPTRPDLSALPLDVQLRIEVAETQGATWNCGGRASVLTLPVRHSGRNVWLYANGRYRTHGLGYLPNYLTDPAAWGALMERETVGWVYDDRFHRCDFIDSEGYMDHGPWAETLPRAVCLAVLAKHGRDTSRYTEGEAR